MFVILRMGKGISMNQGRSFAIAQDDKKEPFRMIN
jgi:hypothetical protein